MKKCVKSQPEPNALASYRQLNPGHTWEKFRDENPEGYFELRQVARQDQGGLCAYCELLLREENEQIAHFHPKSDRTPTHNWALDWANLWLACRGGSQTWMHLSHEFREPLPENLSCDECKQNNVVDGIVLAPHEVPAFPRIFRYLQYDDRIDITVDEQCCMVAGIDVAKAEKTIEVFNLNCPRLGAARLALHRQLEAAIRVLRKSGRDPELGLFALARSYLNKDADGRLQQFFTLVRWRLGKYAENHLQYTGYVG